MGVERLRARRSSHSPYKRRFSLLKGGDGSSPRIMPYREYLRLVEKSLGDTDLSPKERALALAFSRAVYRRILNKRIKIDIKKITLEAVSKAEKQAGTKSVRRHNNVVYVRQSERTKQRSTVKS